MDSNLSRLYYMLGNCDEEDDDEERQVLDVPLTDPTISSQLTNKNNKRSKASKRSSLTNAESDTLLRNGNHHHHSSSSSIQPSQIVVVELPPPKPPKPFSLASTNNNNNNNQTNGDLLHHQKQVHQIIHEIANEQQSSPTAATLDISSSTTVINPQVNHHHHDSSSSSSSSNLNSNTKMVNYRRTSKPSIPESSSHNPNSNLNPLSKQPSVELHFNPLYTISDGGSGDGSVRYQPQPNQTQQQPNQSSSSSSSHSRLPYPSINSPTSLLPMIGFNFPNNSSSNNNPNHTQLLMFGGQPSPPKDRYGLIYASLLLAGLGFLLPYNSFVMASDYFIQRFPSSTIVFDMSTTYIVMAFCTVICSNLVVDFVPLFWRLNFGYLLSLAIMLIVAVYEIWAKLGGYMSNLVLIGVAAIGCTIQQSTFYGYTSMLPKKYTQAVMIGESAAGIFVSLNRIITKLLYPHDDQYNTALFFAISILVIVLCALIHIVILPRCNFIRYYILLCNNANQDQLISSNNNNNNPHQSSGQRRQSRRKSRSQEELQGINAARMVHQINENLGLVQMYNQRQQQQQQNGPNYISVNQNISGRPSIYSTGSQLYLDGLIDSNPLGNMNLNNNNNNSNRSVQNMLRTDSMECVLPFGIDDEELAEVEQELHVEQPHSRLSDGSMLHQVPLSHQDSGVDGSLAGDFKTKRATSKLVILLAWFENFTGCFRTTGIYFRRMRACDLSPLSSFYQSLRKKFLIRQAIIIRIWPHILTIILVYFVTLIMFPGIESEIWSCTFHEWMPIILFACFNLTDFIGKLLATCFYRITGCQLLGVALLRLLLIPATALCVTPRLDPYLTNPLWPIMFTIVMGITNGIFGSLPMILAPNKVHENMREITGNLMTFSYIIGLTSGAFASYSLHEWINDHSPRHHFTNDSLWEAYAYNCTESEGLWDSFNPEDEEFLHHLNSHIYPTTSGGMNNSTFVNTTALLQNVAPELLQNSSVFSSSFYHFK